MAHKQVLSILYGAGVVNTKMIFSTSTFVETRFSYCKTKPNNNSNNKKKLQNANVPGRNVIR